MGVKLLESGSLERILESSLNKKAVKNIVTENVGILTHIQNDSAKVTAKHGSLVFLDIVGAKMWSQMLDLRRYSFDELSRKFADWISLFDTLEESDRCTSEFYKSRNLIRLYSSIEDGIVPHQFSFFQVCFMLAVIREFSKVCKYEKNYQKTGALHGLVCRVENVGIQMLSPIFSRLRIGYRELLSPTPENPDHHRVKGTIPPDQEKQLIQTPSSLLFVVLGWSGHIPTVTIEAYLPLANRWFYVPQNIFVKRAYHGVVLLGILIYVIGGFDGRHCYNTTYCFNIEKRRWYRRASMKVPRCYVTALACRGSVCALGGYDGDERFRSCERFDPRTRKWRYFSSMHERRSDASGAVHNGKIYMCGGFNGMEVLKSVEMYDPDQDQWTLISDMLGPRSGQVLLPHQGTLLVIGGFDGEFRLREVESYDQEKNIWVEHIPLLTARSNFAAVVMEDQLYVIGGYNGETTTSEVERFDDTLKRWERVKSLIKHRSAHGACVFKDSMTVSMCSDPSHIIVQPLNMQQPSP